MPITPLRSSRTGLKSLAFAAVLLPSLAAAGEVSVTGEGKVQYTPDSVRLQFTARGESADSQAAIHTVEDKIDAWENNISAYRNQLDKYDTATLNLYSRQLPVERDSDEPPKRHSVATQSVSFTLPALDSLNPVLQAAQDSGLEYNVNDNSFFHSNQARLEREALGKAIDDARDQCQFIAQRLGQSCGEVKTLSTHGSPRPQVMMMEARAKGDGPVTEVGEREIAVSVSATFEID
ncbi:MULTISPECIES: SIMPL domain-containing protein [Marinobacter]|uniref:SIMPL domain-containing protein n=1 Tax=Marinobacter TaxID=2742 RepID=UPI000DAD6FB7|nr:MULTISPECIES: SIMPL domain-containing protein [Marinobacter]